MMTPSNNQKMKTVLEKNTFFFKPPSDVEEEDEKSVTALVDSLLDLKRKVRLYGCKEEVFVDHIQSSQIGLKSILALTGLSWESFKRLLTFIRLKDDPTLNAVTKKDSWPTKKAVREWSLDQVQTMAQKNRAFAEGIVNLFFKGTQLSTLREALPLFELKKLSICKLQFSEDAQIDTIVRYMLKGSLKAAKAGNPEKIIEQILEEEGITFESGKISKVRRTLDFIVPNRQTPKLVIECSYVMTTSSGMGDKAKTEQSVRSDLKRHYPSVLFYGFVDGIGWYVRQSDLRRMVQAFDDVFTFAKEEIERFRQALRLIFGKTQKAR